MSDVRVHYTQKDGNITWVRFGNSTMNVSASDGLITINKNGETRAIFNIDKIVYAEYL